MYIGAGRIVNWPRRNYTHREASARRVFDREGSDGLLGFQGIFGLSGSGRVTREEMRGRERWLVIVRGVGRFVV